MVLKLFIKKKLEIYSTTSCQLIEIDAQETSKTYETLIL
jgi:hypothetical protein